MIRQLASDLRQRSLESPHISMQYTCNWAIDRYSRGKVPPVNENNCSGVYFSLCQLQFFERDCTFAEVLRNFIETRVHDLILFSLGRSCTTYRALLFFFFSKRRKYSTSFSNVSDRLFTTTQEYMSVYCQCCYIIF